MVTLLFAGAFMAMGLCQLLAAGFFLQVWLHRRAEQEYLYFAIATVAIAAYIGAGGVMYWALADGDVARAQVAIDVVIAAAAIGLPALLAFAIRYARARHRVVSWSGYTFGALAVAAVLLGLWQRAPLQTVDPTLPYVHLPLTVVGFMAAFGLVAIQILASGYLLYAYARQTRESVATLIGALALLGAVVHDMMSLGLHWFDSFSMIPVAFLALTFGVAVTVVRRYGRLAQALEKRKLELRQRSDELARSLAQLRHAQEELLHTEHLAVVGEFAAVITHEVRNPMAIVNNAVTSLRRAEALTDDTRTLLGIIEGEMHRLERLVTHLLNYARPLAPQRQPVALRGLIEALLEAHADANPDLEVSAACEGPWPTVYVDADMLASALSNIVTNAVQAMDARGALRVRVARRRIDGVGCVVIGFEDTGEGMTEHQLEQALSPFYTTRPAGTGLGLPNSERIIDAHGGALVLSSERGVGTAVSVILPERPDERLGSVESRRSLAPLGRET
jgi:signal transduction histidine kinase